MQLPQIAGKRVWSERASRCEYYRRCVVSFAACLGVIGLSGCYSYYPYGYRYGHPSGMHHGMPPASVAPAQSSALPPASIDAGEFAAAAPIAPPSISNRGPHSWNGFPGGQGNVTAPPSRRGGVQQDGTVNREVPDPGVLDAPGDSTSSLDESEFSNIAGRDDSMEGDGFSEPIPLTPASRSKSLGDVAAVGQPNPYAYDEKQYRWLRGTVEYDDVDRSWHLMYSERPDDDYGGDFTLVDDPKLDVLRNDDVVFVTGRIDRSVTDRLGKPCYRITGRCDRLKPIDN